MWIDGLFIPWEYVLGWSIELGESNKITISMNKRLDTLGRPVNGLDIIEPILTLNPTRRSVTKRSRTWHLIPSGTRMMIMGKLSSDGRVLGPMKLPRRLGWTHVGYSSSRRGRLTRQVGKLVEGLFGMCIVVYIGQREITVSPPVAAVPTVPTAPRHATVSASNATLYNQK